VRNISFTDISHLISLDILFVFEGETCRDERTVIFCNPDPVLNFQNSVQVQPQSKLFFKIKSPSPNKVQKVNKIQRFNNKYHAILFYLRSTNPVLILNLWSNWQSGSNPDSTKFSIARIQSKSSPMLISGNLVPFCQITVVHF